MAYEHDGDALKGYQPLREGYKPDAGHQPLKINDAQPQAPQDRGKPPSGGSGVKSPSNKKS